MPKEKVNKECKLCKKDIKESIFKKCAVCNGKLCKDCYKGTVCKKCNVIMCNNCREYLKHKCSKCANEKFEGIDDMKVCWFCKKIFVQPYSNKYKGKLPTDGYHFSTDVTVIFCDDCYAYFEKFHPLSDGEESDDSDDSDEEE